MAGGDAQHRLRRRRKFLSIIAVLEYRECRWRRQPRMSLLKAFCEPSCGTMFSVCASCDRGRRYCSEACRSSRRQQQVRATGKRYQSSEVGRRAHCSRQQSYRDRHETLVKHQAMAPIAPSAPAATPSMTQCAFVGSRAAGSTPTTG